MVMRMIDYENLKKTLDDFEVNISLEFYDQLTDFLESDFSKNKLNKARSNDQKLLIYTQLLAIFTSITFAKIRRFIVDSLVTEDSVFPSNSNDETEKQQTPENYEF
jgi:hypothetical protein